jgi:hypothetical protein
MYVLPFFLFLRFAWLLQKFDIILFPLHNKRFFFFFAVFQNMQC